METIAATDLPRTMRKTGLANPYNLPVADIEMIHPRYMVVEHIIYCGKDLGFAFYVHPQIFDYLNEIDIQDMSLAFPKTVLNLLPSGKEE